MKSTCHLLYRLYWITYQPPLPCFLTEPEYKSSPLPPPFYAAKSAKAYGGKAVSGWYYTPPTYYNWYPATKASKGGKGSKAYYYQAEKLTGKVSSEMMSNSNGGERRVVSASSVFIMSVVVWFSVICDMWYVMKNRWIAIFIYVIWVLWIIW